MSTDTKGARAYPLPRPADDPRFNLGLAADVIEVLTRHGYPKITEGADIVELQMALFGFLYAKKEAGQ